MKTKPTQKRVLDISKAVTSYVPKGIDRDSFVYLIKQNLGLDKQGNSRPIKDFLYFLHACKKTGLDPIARQIFAIYRWDSRRGEDRMTIQTSIDGMRAVAQRSGQYAGQDDAIYDPVDEKSPQPRKATVTVYKMVDGVKMATTASARWSEYVPPEKQRIFWDKMPYLMLAKCAEALALRKAFPNELSGVYTDDEMVQAENLSLPKPKPKDLVPAKKLKSSANKIAEMRKEIKK